MSFITSPGVIIPPLTAGGVAYGTGGQAKVNNAGTAGQVLVSGGAGVPTFSNASTVAVTSFSAGSTGLTPATATTGAVSLGGTLAVGSGGTGLATLTARNVILGNGASAPTFVAPGTTGNVLQSNGTTWTSAAVASGGGLTLLATTSLTAGLANITYTSLASAKQFIFFVPLADIDTTGGGGYYLQIELSKDNGANYNNSLSTSSTTDRNAPSYVVISAANLSTYGFVSAITDLRLPGTNAVTLLGAINAIRITPFNNSGATTFSGSAGRVAYLYSSN